MSRPQFFGFDTHLPVEDWGNGYIGGTPDDLEYDALNDSGDLVRFEQRKARLQLDLSVWMMPRKPRLQHLVPRPAMQQLHSQSSLMATMQQQQQQHHQAGGQMVRSEYEQTDGAAFDAPPPEVPNSFPNFFI
ncbi:uncharacterized protein LOC120425490 [Culex pipiens pallens]|uniref:uncharacterized protein LOC120425490 n=1 Tax=Culex pipiens pallens TaxID=42434 RepID=UPI001953CFB0|nr:uncharacterized protein LOC120425490 [Culex pipiens pallens]XP_039445970.1 uncharacterized protein LOC120425490 [Culex pipiens pallens]